jgi:hypothetical protein
MDRKKLFTFPRKVLDGGAAEPPGFGCADDFGSPVGSDCFSAMVRDLLS